MAARQRSAAELCTYLLEPKNWLAITLLALGWRAAPAAGPSGPADRAEGIGWGLLATLFAAVIPTLFIAYGIRRGRWSDRNVGARKARLIVLAFITLSVAVGWGLLVVLRAPRVLAGYLAFMLGSVALLALVTTVWKISIHCAVAAGSVTVLAYAYGPAVLAGFALVAVVGWARVAMTDHTISQVLAGAVVGAAVAALAYTTTGGFARI
jgi:membrane-associated phospholipid phosphatase